MKKTIQILAVILSCIWANGCQKKSEDVIQTDNQLASAQDYMNALPLSSLAPTRQLMWEKAKTFGKANDAVIWVPVHYKRPEFIWHSLDSTRLFSTNYLQQVKLTRDSSGGWKSELVTYFPDSNYKAGTKFFGIVLVRDWQDMSIASYKFEKNGTVLKRSTNQNETHSSGRTNSGMDWIEICYSSSGYNYADMTREVYYWSIDLGCSSYFVGGGSGGAGYSDGTYQFVDPSAGGGNASDAPWVPNTPIKGAPNAIADVKDYNKCFDNIAGGGHQYSVTICVDQPKPGFRDAWGMISSYPNNDFEFMNVGHTFLILKDTRGAGTITRNVGFYPKSGVSPISPVDNGQLNNDEEHYYNVSLTIPIDNSSFFTILDFVAHGNDNANQYDLNSNNCTTFVINALNRAGIRIPATTGYWPGGGGYNPGDLGEDIRNMTLTQGMSKSLSDVAHPNTGKCN